jgi:hypothetical protein
VSNITFSVRREPDVVSPLRTTRSPVISAPYDVRVPVAVRLLTVAAHHR